MAVELIGRCEELLAFDGFLGAVPAGGQALLLEGDAGIGKTALEENDFGGCGVCCGVDACTGVAFAATPAVSSFAPIAGVVGANVTVNGSGFMGATAVAFNGTGASFSVVNDTRMTRAGRVTRVS